MFGSQLPSFCCCQKPARSMVAVRSSSSFVLSVRAPSNTLDAALPAAVQAERSNSTSTVTVWPPARTRFSNAAGPARANGPDTVAEAKIRSAVPPLEISANAFSLKSRSPGSPVSGSSIHGKWSRSSKKVGSRLRISMSAFGSPGTVGSTVPRAIRSWSTFGPLAPGAVTEIVCTPAVRVRVVLCVPQSVSPALEFAAKGRVSTGAPSSERPIGRASFPAARA